MTRTRRSAKHLSSETKAHFRSFANSLEIELDQLPLEDETAIERQRRQVDGLCEAEARFKAVLIAKGLSERVYGDFVKHIIEVRGNILDARPFFRERQTTFVASISPALKQRDWLALEPFRVNYHFVKFAMSVVSDPELVAISKEIYQKREELVKVNLPLAISRARIFFGRTPRSHLTFMDFVQIASEGLLTAIDKFTPPYTPAFRSTAIGRIHGNFIEQYSETSVHFFPIDRRKLYRANKAVGLLGGIGSVDFEKLAEVVNKDAEESERTTAAEIADLMFAASTVSTTPPNSEKEDREDGQERSGSDIEGVDFDTPESRYEAEELQSALSNAIQTLTVRERKLLTMKGVSL